MKIPENSLHDLNFHLVTIKYGPGSLFLYDPIYSFQESYAVFSSPFFQVKEGIEAQRDSVFCPRSHH